MRPLCILEKTNSFFILEKYELKEKQQAKTLLISNPSAVEEITPFEVEFLDITEARIFLCFDVPKSCRAKKSIAGEGKPYNEGCFCFWSRGRRGGELAQMHRPEK